MIDFRNVSPTRMASPIRAFALDETDIKVDKSKDNIGTNVDAAEEEDDGSYRSAQRKRLKALASKFSDYDEDDSESIKQVLAQATATGSPYKRDLTKTVDVDRIINRSGQDPDLVKSLKAQGFEESSSKSKLVYDFTRQQTSSSRDSSPYQRPDPLQYVRPQKATVQPVKPASPTKAKVNVQPANPASPVKTKYRCH